jgi:pyruvate/2-oxoglutarate/acetoin dehydrogenase E1 component/TPP-dependent pyruvate/acetoin dehydrogenase alpha subunit
MNGHFATRTLNADGTWKRLVDHKNVSADISPTGGQMPRLLGLAQASKVYRAQNVDNEFSRKGGEVAWGTIGNASASEGLFWETINAAGVLQVPMVALVWDDEYGISVHAEHQTTKQNISKILAGFQRQAASKGQPEEKGYEIIVARGWNYAELVAAFEKAENVAREEHVPVLLHVREMTQPQGHSTSGSHERYKSKERLEWEQEFDCLRQFRLFLESNKIAKAKDLDALEEAARAEARDAMKAAFDDFLQPLKRTRDQAVAWLEELDAQDLAAPLKADKAPLRRDSVAAVRKAIQRRKAEGLDPLGAPLWVETQLKQAELDYASQLHSGTALQVPVVAPEFAPDAPQVDGRVVLRDNFKALFTRYPETMIFGEDVGHIGDVNQGLEGMQAEFGKIRVSDTGIREATIAGQGIGLAMRGLRPIAEIQYLDYLLYAVQILSDDCATVRWRSAGGQKAPLIVRTRGHRLEGVWHSGSPMQLLLGSLRGMYLCTPRNMVQAAGMYTTLLQADEPAVVIECLNGYRLKEPLPTNLGSYTVPLGRPEILRAGTDVTVVSYGSTLRVIMDAAAELERLGVSIEVVDVQTLLPFDLNADCVASLKRTNRLLVVDEDVPGGAAAYLMQQILEVQGGYRHLDAAPRTLTAKAHRPAYGSDGDYFSKPSAEDVVDAVLELVGE